MDAVLAPISLPEQSDRKPKARRLTAVDVKSIAELVARRKLNESEACYVLGIKPIQWQVYKSRAKASASFESIISRIRGTTINHAMERLERAGDDVDIELPNGRVITKRGDWRADNARLALIAPERFGQQQTNVIVNNQTAIVASIGSESQLAKLIASYAEQVKPVV